MPGAFDEGVPVLAQCHVGRIPVRLYGFRVSYRRRSGRGVRRCGVNLGLRAVVARTDWLDAFDRSDGRGFSPPYVRLNPLLCCLLLDPMHVAHRGRAPVAVRPCMEFLEGIEILAADTAALGQQGREIARPGTEGRGLFQQHGMAGEGLLESPAERHGIALYAGPFAEIVVRRQNLPAAVHERAHRLGVAPAEGGAPDIPRDTSQCVVVCRRTDITHLALAFARGSASVLPDILPTLFPYVTRHIVERRLLGLRARPAFGQIRPDLGVRHRNFPVVVRPPVGDIESERRPVDVDVEPLAMACRRGIDGLTRGPRIGQQERPVHGQPLGGGNCEGIAMIETDIAVPVADLIVMERYGPPILGAR